jgi:LysM repeat protein
MAAVSLIPLRAQSTATAPSGPIPPAATAPVAKAPAVTVHASKTPPPHTVAYTVVKGDSLTKLAAKFNTTRKKLVDINNLASTKLKPGQVIFIPGSAKKSASALAAKAKHHTAPVAQPVQDFDIPASTFASCPVVPSNEDDSDITTQYGKPAPVAQLVSPSEMAAADAQQQQEAAVQERLTANVAPARLTLPPDTVPQHKTAKTVKPTRAKLAQTPAQNPAPSGLAHEPARRQPSSFSRFWTSLGGSRSSGDAGMDSPAYDPSNQWGYRFLKEARALGDCGIDYDDDWRPPGERSSWVMDCSNTSRWLYKTVAGINLPRTASDQYYYLHLQGKAWDVPQTDFGLPDVAYLQRNLKPGDLLFWQNTYRPERQPPITHVMVFLGTNERGQWIMAGSQSSRGGEHNRRDGGPDVYVFRPSQPCGGYTSWFVHHTGRFCAFGRPLEADPSKFALDD